MFCGGTPVTREHVWPNWLNSVLPVPAGPYEEITTRRYPSEPGTRRSHKTPSINAVVHVACGACNSGWMSQLEADTKRLTTPMLQHRQHAVLSSKDQLLLAAWVTKTAMVLDAIFDGPDVFFQAQRDLLRTQHVPPVHARIRMGALDPSLVEAGPVRYLQLLGHVDYAATSRDRADGFVAGLGVGALFFVYLSPPRNEMTALATAGHATPRWFELMPPSTHAAWPPEVLDADASLDVLTGGAAAGLGRPPPRGGPGGLGRRTMIPLAGPRPGDSGRANRTSVR